MTDRRRLPLPDVLRGLAIVAMLIAHAVPMIPHVPGPLRFVMGNINDVASPLFALVMGISAQLAWRASASVGRTLLKQAIRGAVLIALGVWMATWGSWVAIVLPQLGLLLLVGAPLLLLRTKWLAVTAVVVTLASAPLVAWAKTQAWVYEHGPVVHSIAEWVAIGRSYRLLNLLPFFLLGALLLRHGFKRDKLLFSMLAIAPVAYLARPLGGRLLGVDEHASGSYLDTSHDVGLVLAVYCVTVLLMVPIGPRVDRAVAIVTTPVQHWGRLALSLYLLHVGIIAVWRSELGYPVVNSPVGWLLVVVVSLLVASLWWRLLGEGPVERLLALVTGSPRRAVALKRR